MDTATLIERVKKCLALGASCEPHEAALAIQRAQQLMKKYDITADDLAMSEVKEKIAHVNDTLRAPIYLQSLVNLIKTAFGCDVIYHPQYDFLKPNKKVVTVSFIGFEPNPKLATYAFAVLKKQLIEGRKEYRNGLHKNCKKATKTRRANIWADAWVHAANRKVEKLTISPEQNQILEKWIATSYSNLTESNPKKNKTKGDAGDLDAFCAGLIAGNEATLNRPVPGQQAPKAISLHRTNG